MNKTQKTQLLYHYTSAEGLKGILEEKELWATGVFFLNDAKEFAWGLERAREELRRQAECSGDEEQSRRLRWLEAQVRHIGARSFKTAYAASLSLKGDLLSQWRAYCPNGGYSIGFPADQLSAGAIPQQFTLSEITYDIEKQRELLQRVIGNTASTWVTSSKPEPWEQQEGDRFLVNLNWELYRVAPTLKHATFSEEDEWRLLSAPESNADNVRFRSRGGLVLPYVPIRLGDDKDFWREVRVIAGPSPHPELARAGAEALLRKTTGFMIPVQDSAVPYRYW